MKGFTLYYIAGYRSHHVWKLHNEHAQIVGFLAERNGVMCDDIFDGYFDALRAIDASLNPYR